MRITRPKLNYANVIATLALFVALGGVAVAAGLPKNSVGQKQLKRGAVTAVKLKRGAVISGKIAPGAVTAGKLGANAVLPGNLGNGIISTNKLADGAVIASKIKNGVVTTNKLNNGAVTSAKLGDGSVTAAKLAKDAFVMPSALQTGQSVRGTFMLGGNTSVARGAISYPIPLPSTAEAKILEIGQSTPECPGRPIKDPRQVTVEASPGYLCIYVALTQGKDPSLQLKFGETNLGAGLEATFGEADPENTIFGFWTATAGP